MFVKSNNGVVEKFPYSIGQLRKDNPEVSFPKSPSDQTLAAWGVFQVTPTDRPSYDEATQDCNRVNPVLVNGVWTEQWEVTTASADEQAKRLADKEQQVRNQRDNLLSRSDWTQVADAPVDKAAWATYRQALRDVPSQAGFPWTINWPTKP